MIAPGEHVVPLGTQAKGEADPLGSSEHRQTISAERKELLEKCPK
jgi:hypothetical protein